MEDAKLIVKKRGLEGSSNMRRLRKEGLLPGVIYGAGEGAASVLLDMHAFEELLHHHASETLIAEIAMEGAGDLQILVQDVQRHPTTGAIIHVDLLKVVAGQTIQVDILLTLTGEAAGVKQGGILEQVMHSIPVECLPKDLAESIEIDISEMEIGDTLCVSALDLGDKFKTSLDADTIVASVAVPRAEEEEEEEEAGEEAAEGATEPEVISEKKADEEATE